MAGFKKDIWILTKSFAAVLLIYTLLRFIFYWSFFSGVSFNSLSLVLSFVHGLRFDMYCIAFLALPHVLYILLKNIIPIHASFRIFFKWFFVITNSLFVVPIMSNLGYYKYIERHIGRDVFVFSKEASEQNLSLFANYWHLPILALVISYLFYKVAPIYSQIPKFKREKPIAVFLCSLVIIGCLVIAARGGLQSKPLAPIHAYLNADERLATISLNTTFNILRSESFEAAPNFLDGLSSDDYPGSEATGGRVNIPVQKDTNVVVLIMESLALEYLNLDNDQPSWAPFFTSLSQDKNVAFFDRFFANGRRSIDISPSMQASLPNLLDVPFVRGPYQHIKLEGLAEVLAKNGYQTSFFHGTRNNSMFFDSFAARVGFQKYYGLDNYPNQEHFNGYWGIFDEEFLQYSTKILSESTKPFFSTIFTLSAHDPFVVPKKYQEKFKEGSLKIHKSIAYADYSLQKFFETAKKQSWFENTLFVITADHAFTSDQAKFQDIIGRFRVPMLMYHPKLNLSQLNQKAISQHIDLKPTILDFLGLKYDHASGFGKSLLRDNSGGVAFNKLGKFFWYLDKDNLVKLADSGDFHTYSHTNTWDLKLDKTKNADKKDKFIHHVIHKYFQRLKLNK